jgi:predicted alpha/beta hydrolase family esterase
MKNALILHGAANNSQGNWFPWLAKELEKLGYLVWSPDLPYPDKPMKNKWLNHIFTNANWGFNEETIVVGHSAGATLILRILEALPDSIKLKHVLLVAGPVEIGTRKEFFQYKEDLVKDGFDWKKIISAANNFTFIHSDNDPYECGIDQGKILHKKLGGNLICKQGEGHFNLEKGEQYKQFPELLEIIKREV